MKKLFAPILFAVVLFAPTQSHAAGTRPGGDIPHYENLPNNTEMCTAHPELCTDAAKTHAKKHKNNTGPIVLVSVAAGAVFAGAMYYFFKKQPSENNPGQVKLAEF